MSTNQSNNLRPCPFCGEQVFTPLVSSLDDGYTRCISCGAKMQRSRWQARPIEDELRKRIAELESTLSANNELLIPALKKRESEIVELSNKTISKLRKRIAKLEAENDQLIEVGNGMKSFLTPYVDGFRDSYPATSAWESLVKDWKEREKNG